MDICFREIIPPSAVHFSVSGKFIDDSTPCLIVSKGYLLQIYTVQEDKLYLYFQTLLHGVIVDMKEVNLSKGKASILLAFKDAKLSLLEYDSSLHDLITVSIHYFEREEFKSRYIGQNYQPQVQVDPLNKCAALLFYEEWLAIIPFKKVTSISSENNVDASNAPYNPSYIIKASELDKDIKNVVDFVFLHEYSDPTIAVLFQPRLTFHGRLDHIRDNMCVMMFSLNIRSRQYTRIQKIDNLPMSCWKLKALPLPTGGLLVFGTSTLIHVDQVLPICAVAVNPTYKNETALRDIKPPGKLQIVLNASIFEYLDKDCGLLALRNGDLYVIKFVREGRFVTNIIVELKGKSVTPSCSSMVNNDLVFLGSRIGDSLLIKYQALADTNSTSAISENIEDEIFQFTKPNPQSRSSDIIPCKFHVVDSIFTLGPVRDMATGFVHEDTKRKDLQLVACTGHAKNAAIAILTTSVMLKEITVSDLGEDFKQIWCLKGGFDYHKYIILARQSSTTVLEIGSEDMEEISRTPFFTSGTTLFCSDASTFMFQVYEYGIIVVDPSLNRQVQNYRVQNKIEGFSWVDPYLVILLDNGKVRLFRFENGAFQIKERPPFIDHIRVQSCTIFKDENGRFSVDLKDTNEQSNDSLADADQMELEEDEIYGASKGNSKGKNNTVPSSRKARSDIVYYLAFYRQNGALEIHSLPSFETVFYASNFNLSPYLMDDHGLSSGSSTAQNVSVPLNFREIQLVSLGPYNDPYLVARTNNSDVVIYRVLMHKRSDSGFSSIRFVKHFNELIVREPSNVTSSSHSLSSKLVHFNDIGGYSGVFVAGFVPIMILVGSRRFVRIHRLVERGPIGSFSELNSNFCHKGLVYLTEKGELVIAEIPKSLNLDYDLPMQKIPMKRTVSAISFHPESRAYGVATSTSVPFKLDRESETPENAAAVNSEWPPLVEAYKLELISSRTWAPIDEIGLLPNEHVTCLRCVSLSTSQSSSGRRSFLVVGTGINRGEDSPMRGRTLVLDVIEVVPLPGRPETNRKFKVLYEKEGNGSISAVAGVNGFLGVATGNQLYINEFTNDDTLTRIAFFNLDTYCVSINSVKNYILTGDVYKGLWFLAYQEDPSRIALLGKDYGKLDTYATEFLIEDNCLYLIGSDGQESIQLFSYSPNNLHSVGGQRLLKRGDFNVGSLIQKFIRLNTRVMPENRDDSGILKLNDARQLCLFGTLDGALGFVSPLPEQQYKRLSQLYNKMNSLMAHTAGLNPKAFRLSYASNNAAATGCPYFPNPTKSVLDLQLIFRFVALSLPDQQELAKSIGTTIDRIYQDLLELQWTMSVL